MILVVDDLRSFPFDAIYARSSGDAIFSLRKAYLAHRPIEELWLDHDLSGDDTTMPVVELLERWAFGGYSLPIGLVVIHSANPVGAKNIMAALSRYYRVVQVDAAAHGATSPEW